MFNINEKIATGVKAVGAKAIKAAGVIDNTCKGIAWNAMYRQVRALEKENKAIKSIMIGLKCRMELNDAKIAVLKKNLN